jgi:hypothetical protein
MQLIHTVKTMRDEGKFINGSDVDVAPKLFIGAASNPFAEPFDFRVYRLAKKISAGADFIQTQCIYNMDKFREFMKRAVDMGLHEKCYILAGVTPMKSVGMALYMSKQVPGMDVPESLSNVCGAPAKGRWPKKESNSPWNRSKNSKKWKGLRACISWPSSGNTKCPKSPSGPGFCRGPWYKTTLPFLNNQNPKEAARAVSFGFFS